jgi:hypothetical protein
MSPLAIAITIAVALALVGALVAIIFWIRRLATRSLEEAKGLARGVLIAAGPMASYQSRSDRGLKQVGGNCSLVLSEKTLVSIRWVPKEVTVLEKAHVRSAKLVNQFGPRWLPGKPRILVLEIKRPTESFQIGFMPREADKWLQAIEAWRNSRR